MMKEDMSIIAEQMNMLADKVNKLSGNKMSDISERKEPLDQNELKTLQEQIKGICQRGDIRAEIDELRAELDKRIDSWQDGDQPVHIEWKEDIVKYFIRQIDIWLKNFAKQDKSIEEIKVFIENDTSQIGMELLIDGIWDQLCFSNHLWQDKYLEHADWMIRDEVKECAFLDELWAGFCEEASDAERSRMIDDIVLELQKKFGCKVTAVQEMIQYKE